MKNQDLNAMSLADLTALYNKHSTKQIKKFSCSRTEAVKKVQAVLPKQTTVKAHKGKGIGATCVEMIKKGVSNEDIFALYSNSLNNL